ncbi:hypothetical protein [Vibrio alginolyticus]|uniref:hypothetical protein n=1 Tax=Vibrio TaxID=662 RepID=UPI0006CA9534|nr:hypothetical protein [Vibrio alginolyticus]KPM97515.1 hypothetical protein AOG25_13670 [Vibrio alginolyticus]CAH7192935.1 conserved hypothetical protein [Vibrio chagasii]CAH7360770.1 conserved hypothetical protein [Vibrio chagasii]
MLKITEIAKIQEVLVKHRLINHGGEILSLITSLNLPGNSAYLRRFSAICRSSEVELKLASNRYSQDLSAKLSKVKDRRAFKEIQLITPESLDKEICALTNSEFQECKTSKSTPEDDFYAFKALLQDGFDANIQTPESTHKRVYVGKYQFIFNGNGKISTNIFHVHSLLSIKKAAAIIKIMDGGDLV